MSRLRVAPFRSPRPPRRADRRARGPCRTTQGAICRIRFASLGLAAALASTALTATAQDWRARMPVFRIGLLGGKDESDRLRNNECLRAALQERLGVPVELFPAPD